MTNDNVIEMVSDEEASKIKLTPYYISYIGSVGNTQITASAQINLSRPIKGIKDLDNISVYLKTNPVYGLNEDSKVVITNWKRFED